MYHNCGCRLRGRSRRCGTRRTERKVVGVVGMGGAVPRTQESVRPASGVGDRQELAATDRDTGVGGAGLASAALAAQLVNEYHLVIAPYVAGGGKRALLEHVPLQLELQDEQRFACGMVYLRYRVEYIEPVAKSVGSSGI